MILITSTFGPTKEYKDQAMMALTLKGFLNSLARQTDKNFRLFLICHDVPVEAPYHPFVQWVTIGGRDGETCAWKRLPENIGDPGETETLPFDCPMTDMSRKTYHGQIEAARWARKNDLDEFWILRMDSDDLLAWDHVERLEHLNRSNVQAVYNRTCHMFDPKQKRIAIHRYPYSTTCNAIRLRFEGDRLPRWFYHCTDHTLFMRDVARDGIPRVEMDHTLCIVTNSGNSISDRPPVERERFTERIPLTRDLVERYGLESFSG